MLDAVNSDMFDSKLAFEGKREMGPEIAKSLADFVNDVQPRKLQKTC